MKGGEKISVIRSKTEVVTALRSPLEDHPQVPLSNLDLLLPPEDVAIFLCYKKPTNEGNGDYYTFSKIISILKDALSVSLLSFYIFSGEIFENIDGKPVVLCNNGGVDFVEAYVDVNLKDLDFHNPHQSVDGILIPERIHGVLAIQVTQLKCGGLVISCTFDHRVSDAYSANMFLLSWAEIAQSKSLASSIVPSFDRTMLSPRRPLSFDLSVVRTFIPIPMALSPLKDSDSNGIDLNHQAEKLVRRIYYMEAENVAKLQSQANHHNNEWCRGNRRKTKLEAFSAWLWKAIASGEHMSEGKSYKMGIVVDGRASLDRDGYNNENEEKTWNLYFGNVLSIPFGEMTVDELKRKPINLVADSIHEFLKPARSTKHFLGLVDYVEAHRPKKLLAKIYAEEAVVVSSGLRFPIRKMDFGWGVPMFGSYHFSWKGKAGYVMPMPSAKGNGDWVIYMNLLERQLDLIEKVGAGIVKPLTQY